MTRIESDTKTINKEDKVIFNFLSNFNNFEKLMPDKVENWQSTEDTCNFTISGLADLGMQIIEKKEYNSIKIKDYQKVPFKFDFFINIANKGDKSDVNLIFDADLNPMLKMLAVKPLRNFLNMLLDELENTDI